MTATPDDIRTYRLDPRACVAAAKRRLYRRFAWLLPLLVGATTVECVLLSRSREEGSFDTLPLTIVIVVVALGFGVFRGIRQQLARGKPAWDSYRLTMSANVLRRVAANLPSVEILRSEVTKIVAQAEGLTVATEERQRFIFVPEHLIEFSDLQQRLSTWRPFEAPKVARNRLVRVAWTIALLGSWLAVGLIPDLRWAMLAGVLLLALVSFNIRETLKLQVVDNRHKATLIGGLMFLMLAPVARLALHFAFRVDVPWAP